MVKNIIPAVASTNAIISAGCVNEAVKACTFRPQIQKDYYMIYVGTSDANISVTPIDRKPDCPTCGVVVKAISVPSSTTVEEVMDMVKNDDTLCKEIRDRGLCK